MTTSSEPNGSARSAAKSNARSEWSEKSTGTTIRLMFIVASSGRHLALLLSNSKLEQDARRSAPGARARQSGARSDLWESRRPGGSSAFLAQRTGRPVRGDTSARDVAGRFVGARGRTPTSRTAATAWGGADQ